jgi:flavodoxin
MKTALVVYQSMRGTTRALGDAIAAHLKSRGVEAKAVSIGQATAAEVAAADIVLLGCWTAGLFIILQHPDRPWTDFVARLPQLKAAKLGLFTTYKLATGSMFKRMSMALAGKGPNVTLTLRSRGPHLADAQKAELDRFIA